MYVHGSFRLGVSRAVNMKYVDIVSNEKNNRLYAETYLQPKLPPMRVVPSMLCETLVLKK